LTPHRLRIATGDVIVLYIDECHLVWGDVCGYVWGPSNERVTVPIVNQRARQSYYGAIDARTGELMVIPVEAGNTQWILIFVEYLRQRYEGKQLVICWDGASYHRSIELCEYLEGLNGGLSQAAWWITCVQFAPNAPEQNPIEDVWLQAKTYVRNQWHRCQQTFQSVTDLFEEGLNAMVCDFAKLRSYLPDSEII
jgi:transposase